MRPLAALRRVSFQGYKTGKDCLSRIYENLVEVNPAGSELRSDGTVTGYSVFEQAQERILTTSLFKVLWQY